MGPEPDYSKYVTIQELGIHSTDLEGCLPQAAFTVEVNRVRKGLYNVTDVIIAMCWAELNGNLKFDYYPLSVLGVCSCLHLGYQYGSIHRGMFFQRYLPIYDFNRTKGYGSEIKLAHLISEEDPTVYLAYYGEILGYLDLYGEEQDGSSISINRVTAAISRQLLPPIYKEIRNKGAGAIASYLLASKIIKDRELRFWLGECLVKVIESVRNPEPTPDQNQYEDQNQG